MKQQIKPLAVSLCLLGIISTPALAATDSSQMRKLEAQISQLQNKVNVLEAQSETEQPKKRMSSSKHHKKSAATQTATESSETSETTADATGPGAVHGLPTSGATYLPVDVEVPGQSFVSSGPYIGVPFQFSGMNLVINTPSVNQDVSLLQVRKNIRERLEALGIERTDHAHVLLSGIVEGQGLYKNIGGGADSTDIDLTNVTLDAYILGPTQWLSSLISMTYDNDLGTNSGSFASNSRALNSRVYIKQAFVTIGNFSQTPVYGTFGQMYVPFGTYSSSMVSAPLTQSLFRTKARAILLGVQPQKDDAFYAAGYIFKGDAHAGSTSRVNNGGINLGYHFKQNGISGEVGGGAIGNVADSIGMQDVSNSAGQFNGFGGTTIAGLNTGNEHIVHRVVGYEARGSVAYGQTNLLIEYITSASSFDNADLTMNSHGAKPQALNAEAAYTFNAFARPSSLALGYGMTKDALAFELPTKRYSVVFNTSVWKDTLQSLELRHDINYSASDYATGSMVVVPHASGKADNVVTAQFDVYF